MTRDVLLLATNNGKKARELAAMAGEFEVMTLKDAGLDVDVVEDGDTFAENAAKKARGVHAELAKLPLVTRVLAVMADDSGLCVDHLGGGPGIRSARFALDHDAGKGDEDNNRLLLDQLRGVPAEQRGAHFACAICTLVLPDESVIETEGRVPGRIAVDQRGTGGFGYDPLFIPDAHPERRMAELAPDEKHAISHRGQAVRAALAALRAHA